MQPVRMVRLTTVSGLMEAQVLTARLGAEGIVWETRGGDPVYPLGAVDVLVDASDADDAMALLLSDEVEHALDGGTGSPVSLSPGEKMVLLGLAAFALLFLVARLMAVG